MRPQLAQPKSFSLNWIDNVSHGQAVCYLILSGAKIYTFSALWLNEGPW